MKNATAIILAASLAMPMAAVMATPAASWVKINNWITNSNKKIKETGKKLTNPKCYGAAFSGRNMDYFDKNCR